MPGFIGSFSYSQRNLFGLNQKLAATVELGQVDVEILPSFEISDHPARSLEDGTGICTACLQPELSGCRRRLM